jgi:hypothetical protein
MAEGRSSWLKMLSSQRGTVLQFFGQLTGTSRIPYVVGIIALTLAAVELASLFVSGSTGGQIRLAVGIAYLATSAAYLPWLSMRWKSERRKRQSTLDKQRS